MIEGQMQKFYSEVVLYEQPYVKEPAKSIAAVLREAAKTLGPVEVVSFVRFQLGEEIEGEAQDQE
jgi:elongation factor Ts